MTRASVWKKRKLFESIRKIKSDAAQGFRFKWCATLFHDLYLYD
jgi:hypothetical protein